MPKIPLPQNRTVSHVAAETPLTGGGLKLHYYGDNGLGDAFSSLSKSLDRGSALMMEFKKEYEDTENRLAAAEDRSIFNKWSDDYFSKLANNPGADDKTKNQWFTEFEDNYKKESEPVRAKMTAPFLKLHDSDMAAMRQSFTSKQRLLIIESSVTRQKNLNQQLIDTAISRGDFKEVRQLISENTGTLYSHDQAKFILENDIPMREQYYQASRLAEADPDKAVTMLEDQKNFDKLSIKNRDQLIRFAKAKSAENTTEYLSRVIAQMNAGNFNASSDDIKRQYETGAISQAQFNAVMPYIQKYEAQQIRDQQQDLLAEINIGDVGVTAEQLTESYINHNISQAEYNALFPLLKRYEEAVAQGELAKLQAEERQKEQQSRLQQLHTEDKVGAFVYNTIYGPDGGKRTYSEADLAVKRLELFKLAGGNRSVVEKYLPKLNSALAPADADGSKKTPDFWKTPDGEVINKWITKIGKDNSAYRWMPENRWYDFSDNEYDDLTEEQKQSNHLRMELQYRQLAEALYARYNDTEKVINTLIEVRKQLNDGTVSNFLQWRESNLPPLDIKLGNPIGQPNKNLKRTGR